MLMPSPTALIFSFEKHYPVVSLSICITLKLSFSILVPASHTSARGGRCGLSTRSFYSLKAYNDSGIVKYKDIPVCICIFYINLYLSIYFCVYMCVFICVVVCVCVYLQSQHGVCVTFRQGI